MSVYKPIPGDPLERQSSDRLLRVFLYKFFRGTHVVKANYFDKNTRSLSDKKKWHFKFSGPYFANPDELVIMDRSVLSNAFFQNAEKIFWVKGARVEKRIPPQISCTTPKDFSDYFLNPETALQFYSEALYVFDISFSWYICIRNSLLLESRDDYDFMYFCYMKDRRTLTAG